MFLLSRFENFMTTVLIKFVKAYQSSNVLCKFEPTALYRSERMPYIAWNPFAPIRQREDIAALRMPFPFGLMPTNYTREVKWSSESHGLKKYRRLLNAFLLGCLTQLWALWASHAT